jgi:hypothetical protein
VGTAEQEQDPFGCAKWEDVTNEVCAHFYKSLSNNWEGCLAVKHLQRRGTAEIPRARSSRPVGRPSTCLRAGRSAQQHQTLRSQGLHHG